MIFNESALHGKFLKKKHLLLDETIKECVLARFEEQKFQKDVSVTIVYYQLKLRTF